jgi:hypothetical protein
MELDVILDKNFSANTKFGTEKLFEQKILLPFKCMRR